MAKKGQIFHYYSFETKKKAVAMRLEGMTKKEVASALNISDIGRLKVWMRKYREHGEEGLIDRRRRSSKPMYLSDDQQMSEEDTPEKA